MKIRYISLLSLCLLLAVGCNDEEKKTEKPTTVVSEPKENINQFLLEEDGIKITLPDGFQRYSAVDFQTYLKENYKKEELNFESERFKQLRNMDGTLYIFVNLENHSVYTINSTPPTDLDNIDAQDLLGMVQSKHAEVEKVTNRKYEKVTAKFSDLSSNKIFKAVYKVTGKDIKEPLYSHSYIISNAGKTLYINLYSPGELDFDPYIEKMRF
ncbi:hypothetical protein SAMN03097699_1491 [Flavobacteriaceae bacterium MAR_2010_188]|nr:hypothetical protein SAMN03097699_1491 [Flavobacteriaceae bacterium MAR_2010_188]